MICRDRIACNYTCILHVFFANALSCAPPSHLLRAFVFILLHVRLYLSSSVIAKKLIPGAPLVCFSLLLSFSLGFRRDPSVPSTAHLRPTTQHVPMLRRYIIGQDDAKCAVAVAYRNRWRRKRVPVAIRDDIVPKNILLIGPTGCGKTEIARRLAKLANSPFVKVRPHDDASAATWSSHHTCRTITNQLDFEN